MSVFRSNKEIYAQLIDDENGKTLAAASTKNVTEEKANKTQLAEKVGTEIAKKALDSGINTVVFDRNGYLYHGRVKALAEAARKGGLKF
jgi:large subunit ribosomal protein L18